MAMELGPGPVGPWSAEPVFKETGLSPRQEERGLPAPAGEGKLIFSEKKERKPREANGY